MTLLANLARSGAAKPTPQGLAVVDPEGPGVPYLHGSLPWTNPPVPILADHITTADGSVAHSTGGSYVHPSVLDFHGLTLSGLFGGHRFWMVNSEYSSAGKEDNMILCSPDGYQWNQPAGAKPGVVWTWDDQPPVQEIVNSDPELIYDAARRILVMLWRQNTTPGRLWHSESTDGVTWSPPHLVWETDLETFTSPCVVPDGQGGWIMVTWGRMPRRRTASSLKGPWSEPTTMSGISGWHGGAWRDPASGRLYGVSGGYSDKLEAYTSDDEGHIWKKRQVLLSTRTDMWDSLGTYRPTIQPHPDGKHMRLWYATYGFPGDKNRTGYTVIPRALWGD